MTENAESASPVPSAYWRGAGGDHWCDLRQRGHYDPCGCHCEPCKAAHIDSSGSS